MDQEKDKFATIVDSYFNDENGCIDGELPAYTFTIPTEYRDYQHLIPCDTYVQEKVVTLLKEVAAQLGTEVEVGSTSTFDSSRQGHAFGDICALRTTGDGDCLLHALSLCMWGREDHYRLLRGLMSLAFANPELSTELEGLFVKEEKLRDIELGFGGAREDKLLREEYTSAADRAFTAGSYLEGVHLACLSHLLRRPLVVLDGDDAQRLAAGSPDSPCPPSSSSGGQSMAGVYLPVLHPPSHCASRSPLVVAYTNLASDPEDRQSKNECAGTTNGISSGLGHFTAVVGNNFLHPSSCGIEQTRTVPLVTACCTSGRRRNSDGSGRRRNSDGSAAVSLSPMRVRYGAVEGEEGGSYGTASDEELASQRLLQQYMDIESLQGSGILVAKQYLNCLSGGGDRYRHSHRQRDKDKDRCDVTNYLLSSTGHLRCAELLEDVVRDKEEECIRLQERLAALKHEIHVATRDKEDSELLITRTFSRESRHLKHWLAKDERGNTARTRTSRHASSSSKRDSVTSKTRDNADIHPGSAKRSNGSQHLQEADTSGTAEELELSASFSSPARLQEGNQEVMLSPSERYLRRVEEKQLLEAMEASLEEKQVSPPLLPPNPPPAPSARTPPRPSPGPRSSSNSANILQHSPSTPDCSYVVPSSITTGDLSRDRHPISLMEKHPRSSGSNDCKSGSSDKHVMSSSTDSPLYGSRLTELLRQRDAAMPDWHRAQRPAHSPDRPVSTGLLPNASPPPERRYRSTLASKLAPSASSHGQSPGLAPHASPSRLETSRPVRVSSRNSLRASDEAWKLE